MLVDLIEYMRGSGPTTLESFRIGGAPPPAHLPQAAQETFPGLQL